MQLTLALAPLRTSAPILVVSILLGLLLSPVLERAIESWMPGTGTATDTQQKTRSPDRRQDDSTSWDLRSM